MNQKGDDIVTTFIGGCVGLVIFGSLFILALSWLFS